MAPRALWYLFFLILALGISPGARGADVAVILSDSGGAYAEFANTLQQLAAPPWRIRWSGTAETLDAAAFRADIIVAVGTEATRVTLKRSEGRPIIATLLPRQTYERILVEAGPGLPRTGHTAITLDQPIPRLMTFIRTILPDKGKVGVLTGPETRNLLPQVKQSASQAGLGSDSEDVEGESTLVPALGQLFARTDVLLALPDASVYRRDNIRVILLTSYRHQRPVVAFSQAFVTAGALAAVYSSPSQIARQASDLLRALNPEAINLPPPQAPTFFSVAVNRNVAQSLGLALPDDASIRRAIGADREAR